MVTAAKHQIKVRHSSIVVTNYTMDEQRRLQDNLSVWNASYFRLEPIGYSYDEERKELLLPRGIDIAHLEKLFQTTAIIDYEHDPFDSAVCRLVWEPRSDTQRKSIAFLLGEGEFSFAKKYSQMALDLDTGDGKTYCVVAKTTFSKTKTLVMTHNNNIKQQWLDSYTKMTDMKPEFILDITGSAGIKRLMNMKTIPYKVFMVTRRTLQSYAKKEGWRAVGEFIKKLKVGMKVFDEAHIEFETINKIDLYTNTKLTLYLTANMERSDVNEDRVFKLCFKNVPKFGRETRDSKRRHIIIVMVRYNSKPNLDDQLYVKGTHGFDKNRYIDYELEQSVFYDAIMKVCNFIGNQEGKLMMTFSKNDAIDQIEQYLLKNYEARTPHKFNSTVSEEDKAKALNSELILTTPKSLGTGSDIPGLRFLLNTEQFSSNITGNQLTGRLREYAPDKFTFFFDVVDIGFPHAKKMMQKRINGVYKKKAHEIIYMDV